MQARLTEVRQGGDGLAKRWLGRENLLKGALLFLLILMPSTALAQTAPRTWAYAFGGVGGISPDDTFTFWNGTTVRTGFSVEHLFRGGFGILGEMEILHRSDIGASSASATSLLLSVNPVYQFGTGQLRPFVTGGYTAIFGSHGFFNVNVGGGVSYWLQEHIAVRAEFRNHILFFSTPLNSYGLRLGLGFGF